MSSAKGVWVLVEKGEEEIEEFSLEILSEGRRFADQRGEELTAVTFEADTEETVDILAGYGADNVYFLDNPLLLGRPDELCGEALFQLVEKKEPAILLFGASLFGSDLASRLAARLKTGVVSDCVGLSLNAQGRLLQTKLTHGSKIATTMMTSVSAPQIASVRPGILQKRTASCKEETRVMKFRPELSENGVRMQSEGVVMADPERIGLDEADIIISGGRGMGSAQNFRLLKDLAGSLSGVVASSLGAVDEGLAPRQKLVGQTGATVAPKLYVACGISGSIYHVLGMQDSDTVIAINKDRHAPIFKYSDMGLVGDVVEIVPALTKVVRQALGDSGGRKNGQGDRGKI